MTKDRSSTVRKLKKAVKKRKEDKKPNKLKRIKLGKTHLLASK